MIMIAVTIMIMSAIRGGRSAFQPSEPYFLKNSSKFGDFPEHTRNKVEEELMFWHYGNSLEKLRVSCAHIICRAVTWRRMVL
jgi:hypothetical protein